MNFLTNLTLIVLKPDVYMDIAAGEVFRPVLLIYNTHRVHRWALAR